MEIIFIRHSIGIKRLSLLFLVFLIIGNTIAQKSNYTSLMSSGQIPPDFIDLSSERYKRDIENMDGKSKKKIKKAKESFYLNSHFSTRDILYSGKVIFNDPISKYCQRILDNVFIDNPEEKQNIRIYTLRVPEVNAFATDEGIIFVTLGLIERLENEAQMAFILSHEVAHYKFKHNIESAVEIAKLNDKKGKYRGIGFDSKILAKHAFSRELEKEADIYGLKLIMQSRYCPQEAISAFDILKYCYLPYQEKKFNYKLLKTKYTQIPKKYTLVSANSIDEREEDFPDIKSSHPNIFKRKKYIRETIGSKKNAKFIQEEKLFWKIINLAREDMASVFLYNTYYERALYQAFLNITNKLNVKHNMLVAGKSLYMISKIKSKKNLSSLLIQSEEDSLEGNISSIVSLINQMSAVEFSLMALGFNYQLINYFPNNDVCKQMVKDLAFDYGKLSNPEKDIMVKKKKKSKKDRNKTATVIDIGNEIKKKTVLILNKENYKSMFNDALIKESLAKGRHFYDNKKKEIIEEEVEDNDRLEYDFALGIDKMVFVNPVHARYRQIWGRKKLRQRHIQAEKSEINLNRYISESSTRANLDYEILDDKNMTSSDVDKYNDMCNIQEWIETYGFIENFNLNVVNIKNNETAYLKKKYKTDYFCWMGFISFKKKMPPIYYTANLGLLGLLNSLFIISGLEALSVMFGILPLGIFALDEMWKKTDTYFYYMVFDMSKKKIHYLNAKKTNFNDYPAAVGVAVQNIITNTKKRIEK